MLDLNHILIWVPISEKKYFEKDLLNFLTNAVFGKTMGNVRKHRDAKLATTEKRSTIWC